MAEIVIWNSVAKRRRSISDTFYDNGLASLKGYLESKGHIVEVVDWAKDDYYKALSPGLIPRWLRAIYSHLINIYDEIDTGILGFIAFKLQNRLIKIQEKNFKKLLDALVKKLKDKDTRVLGVKLWQGESFENAKELIAQLKKELPEMITICGGPLVSIYEERVLENSDFDFGVICEGEYALEELLKIAERYKAFWDRGIVLKEIVNTAHEGKLENLLYRKDGKIFKARRGNITGQAAEIIPKYAIDENKMSIHTIAESLGCSWGKCNFCIQPYFYPNHYLKDPDVIIREVEEMMNLGIGIFRFIGSDTPAVYGAKLAQRLLNKKLKIIFGMNLRVVQGAKNATLYESLLSHYTTMIKGGLKAVYMGAESANSFINRAAMNKGITNDDIIYTVKALREAEKNVGQKVYLSLSLIYPVPFLKEVNEERLKEENMHILKEVMPDGVMIAFPEPLLHSKWFDERARFGFLANDETIKELMGYEYTPYLPAKFWPKMDIGLGGYSFSRLIEERDTFSREVEGILRIPTFVTDEHFLIFSSAGIINKVDIMKAKRDAVLDILSCDYRISKRNSTRVNAHSKLITQK